MISLDKIQERLLSHFEGAQIKVKDLTGSGDHLQIEIKASSFKGKSLIEQHQLVYKALGDWMKKEIHAVVIHSSILED
jgi:stress-induced morphogen